jgi:hypothetical protein
MSVSLEQCLIKHASNVSNTIKEYFAIKCKYTNGYYYMIPVKDSVHCRTLKRNDYEYYEQYLIAVKDTITHSPTKFKSLVETFDLGKMEPIQANMYDHSIGLWIQDGNHRIAILLYKQLFGTERIPMRYINVNMYEPIGNYRIIWKRSPGGE